MSTTLYCGLDFHKNFSELCLMDESGKVVDRSRVRTELLVKHLANRAGLHIAVEASGGVFDVCEKLKENGHRVTLINPSQFRAIGIAGRKNDRRDAEALALALRLGFVPEVYQKTLYARRIQSLLMSRELVVRIRVQVTNHVRAILREYGVVMPVGPTAFWNGIREHVASLQCGAIRQVLEKLVEEASRLKDQEKEIGRALETLCAEDTRIGRLETVPGVGRLTACAFVSTFDEVTRFENAKKVGAFLGLVPKENSSGDRKRFGSISKAGPELLRRFLVHGARASLARPSRPVHRWAEGIEKRSGFNKAVVALAHKNARICFALLRDETTFGVFKRRAQEKAA